MGVGKATASHATAPTSVSVQFCPAERAPCYPAEDANPGGERYQKLSKEAAGLAPLADGYEALRKLRAEVGWGWRCTCGV